MKKYILQFHRSFQRIPALAGFGQQNPNHPKSNMKPVLSVLFLIFISSSVYAGDLKPFTSDGCSSFPDGTISQKNLWLKCCFEHDKAYWAGGTDKQRKKADEVLKECVTNVGEPEIARLMLAGVRVGGTPYLPTTFRWGYGWPFPRGYKVLSEEEKAEIEVQMKKFNDK